MDRRRARQQVRAEISPNPDFSANPGNDVCTTVHTTYTPTKADDCWPTAAGTYYWRVPAIDEPQSQPNDVDSQIIYAEIGHFTYPPTSSRVRPGARRTVEVPTLSWQPVAGAAQYKVTITDVGTGSVAATVTTAALTYTPRSLLTVGNTYRWQVQPVSDSGRIGAGLLMGPSPSSPSRR